MTTSLTTAANGIPGAEWLTPATMEQGMQLANLMADCTLVPDHLKKKPGDCFPILVQALRWRMDPFAVAQATAVVRGKLCYEGKLVHAVLISMGAIDGRLSFEYSGDGMGRKVIVAGTPKGDKPRTISGTVSQWKTDNGNWQKDPDMMLAYRGTRAWARLYCPDAMLGVYTPDEMETAIEVEGTVVPEAKPAVHRAMPAETAPVAVEPQTNAAPSPQATEPATGMDPAAGVDSSVEACKSALSRLWKTNGVGKEAGKAILAAWNLQGVGELAGATPDDRLAFIAQVVAKIAEIGGGK